MFPDDDAFTERLRMPLEAEPKASSIQMPGIKCGSSTLSSAAMMQWSSFSITPNEAQHHRIPPR